ncbi:MAG TPA: hypothetical protein P5567_13675 [Kiritimatiellia bacterium]|nr:hypothetical protein [Kiritimatiellia bacterium]HRZ13493.1 hypothetical protein [Kiritimatiellia bacterium]HSA19202.1 hypothetical protein [Kiritimatiellia bacterium]
MKTPSPTVLLWSAAVIGALRGNTPVRAEDATWTGMASANWGDTNNWSPRKLPTASDHALIPAGTPSCTNTSGATVDRLTVGGELTLRNGTFNLTTTGDVAGVLNLHGALLRGAGSLTVDGSFNWTANDIDGLGRIVLSEGSVNVISGAASPNKHLICPVENRGRLIQRNTGTGSFYIYAGGVVDNWGSYEIEDDSYIAWFGTRGEIRNHGVFQKTGGSGRNDIQVHFRNEDGGLIGSTSSTGLSFSASFSAAGTGSIGTGTVNVTAGSGTLGGVLGGPGALRLAGGSLSVTGASEVGCMTLAGGTLMGADVLTVTQSLAWTAGVITGAFSVVLAPGTTNTISGTAVPNKHLRAVLENRGTVRQFGTADTAFFIYAGGVLDNWGSYEIEDDSCIVRDTSQGEIRNHGVFRKAGGSGRSEIRVYFRNEDGGLIGSTSSTGLAFGASFSAAGTGAISTGTVSVTAGNGSMGGALGGPGVLRLAGGFLSVTGASQIGCFALAGGTLTGAEVLTVTQSLAWTAGVMTGACRMVLSPGTTNTISGTATPNKHLGAALENHGRLRQFDTGSGSFYVNRGGVLDNRGIYQIEDDSDITFNVARGVVTNAGWFLKTDGAGISQVQPPFVNATGGVLASRSGCLMLSVLGMQDGILDAGTGATIQVSGGFTNNGVMRGAGSISLGTATVLNRGTAAPGSSVGRLTITGHFAQASSGVLEVELGGTTPGSGHDQLVVTGNAAVDGTLRVTLDGGYFPAEGSIFAFMVHGARSGSFTTSDLPTLPAGSYWGQVQNANQSYLFREPAFTTGGVATAWYRLKGAGPAAGEAWDQAQWDAIDGLDTDLDGDINSREYVADTNPTNGASFFPRVAFAGDFGFTADMAIPQTSTGRMYAVEATVDLRAGDWALILPEEQGVGGTILFILTNNAPFRSYRTRVRLP